MVTATNITGKRKNVEINNSPQAGFEPRASKFQNPALFWMSSYGKVLDFKSACPCSIPTWGELLIVYFYISPSFLLQMYT